MRVTKKMIAHAMARRIAEGVPYEVALMQEKQYKALIARVRKIDPEAAKYLEGPARELPDFDPEPRLDSCFSWAATPQRFDYWSRVSDQVDYDCESVYDDQPMEELSRRTIRGQYR